MRLVNDYSLIEINVSFETHLQKLSLRFSPVFIWRGSRRGNMMGNQENISRNRGVTKSILDEKNGDVINIKSPPPHLTGSSNNNTNNKQSILLQQTKAFTVLVCRNLGHAPVHIYPRQKRAIVIQK